MSTAARGQTSRDEMPAAQHDDTREDLRSSRDADCRDGDEEDSGDSRGVDQEPRAREEDPHEKGGHEGNVSRDPRSVLCARDDAPREERANEGREPKGERETDRKP